MKYVVDECVSISWPNEYSGSNFIKSIDVVGCGATDDRVLSLVGRLKRGLVTSDRRFAMRAVWDDKAVIYHRINGDRTYIKPMKKKLRSIPAQGYLVTHYLMQNDQIIIP